MSVVWSMCLFNMLLIFVWLATASLGRLYPDLCLYIDITNNNSYHGMSKKSKLFLRRVIIYWTVMLAFLYTVQSVCKIIFNNCWTLWSLGSVCHKMLLIPSLVYMYNMKFSFDSRALHVLHGPDRCEWPHRCCLNISYPAAQGEMLEFLQW